VIDLTVGNGQKSSLGAFTLRYSFLLPLFFSVFLFSFNLVFFSSLGFYMFAYIRFIVQLCSEHAK